MSRPTQARISLEALRHNLEVIKTCAPDSKVLAIVKANAYGHGIEAVPLALPNADAFGVAFLDEAIALRERGISHPLVSLEGFFKEDELPFFIHHQVVLVIHTFWQLETLEKTAFKKAFDVLLKLDSGMNRLGFQLSDTSTVYERLSKCMAVRNILGVMTHFASADDPDPTSALQQWSRFKQVTESIPLPSNAKNSAAIFSRKEIFSDWIRPGLSLYGVSPFPDQEGKDLNLKPAMNLISAIMGIKTISQGEKIGYGGTFTCPHEMKVATIPIGYADGYPREISAEAYVLVNDQKAPVVGRVSMDMLTVDVSNIFNAEIGSPVLLWGEGLPVENVANWAGTIGYTLLTRVSARVPRVYF